MDDLEKIRQRRLRELQQRQEAAAEDQDPAADTEAQRAEEEAALDSLLQKVLDSEARERFTRIRMSRPGFADQVASQLVALARSGRLDHRLSDDELRRILVQLAPEERDINITRK